MLARESGSEGERKGEMMDCVHYLEREMGDG